MTRALPISTIELEIASVVTEIGEQAPYSTPEVRLVSLENRQLRLAIRLRVAVYEQEALAGELIKRLETYCTSKGLTIHRLAPEADSLSGAHP